MNFTLLDWSAIVAYLGITLFLGLYFRSRSGKSVDDYFVSGRNVSWWLAGTSMVATTFAADTPLFVTGVVARNGIAGNWIWWSQCLSGMMTVFFFARYWRRAGILTDVEFVGLRYEGKAALKGRRSHVTDLAAQSGHTTRSVASFLPSSNRGWTTDALWTLAVITLPLYLGVQC